MRRSLLLAASAAALLALPAVAQEATTDQTATDQTATDPATTDSATTEQPADQATTDQSTTGGAATEEQPAADTDAATEAEGGTVVTTTGGEGTEAAPAAGEAPAEATASAQPAGDPMQALSAAADRLRDLGQRMQDGTAMAGAEATTGATGTTADTATLDSAAASTDQGQVTADMQQMQQDATTALDDFDAALQRVGSEGGQGMEDQVASLQTQSQQVRQQLQDDPANAGADMESLADSVGQLQVAGIPAEADAIVGRQVVSSDGEEAGEVSNILVTAEGRVEALLLERGGALGLGGTQVAVTWDQIQLQGDQIMVNMTQDELRNLPEYQTD